MVRQFAKPPVLVFALSRILALVYFVEMEDAFELVDPQDAQAFLKRYPLELRRRGEGLFRAGRVLDLVPKEPGLLYSAVVRDVTDYSVELGYDETEGWIGLCNCSQEMECEHMYAVMSSLLAENRAASVRGLSSGMGSALARLAEARWKQRKATQPEIGELAERLEVAKGKRLTREELTFIKGLHGAFLRCSQSRQITAWDFQQMGLPLKGYSWADLKIWPAFPKNEHEFWLYVANAAQEQEIKIPDFMAPITDLSPIQERMARWKRTQEVEEWKRKLRSLQLESTTTETAPPGETDLRLVVDEHEARLEWRRPGRDRFEAFKAAHLKQLWDVEEEGRYQFTPEADLIWQIFSNYFRSGFSPKVAYDRSEAPRMLGHILRTPLLASHVVQSDGQALARPTEPLRWDLAPAGGGDPDYRLRLVQADGSPAPPILATIPGRPTLYLTTNTVFSGPDAAEDVLEPTSENRIPAPAVESTEGVAFLRSLGLEMPPALRERVKTLRYEVAITCELKRSYPGSEIEECVVKALGEAPDGSQVSWTGSAWASDTRVGRARKKEALEIITYDTSDLQQVPSLLEPLNLKSGSYRDGLYVRVSRKFPETFAAWLKGLPPHITVQLKGELASFRGAEVAGRVKLDVTEAEIDWFDLRVGLDVADTTLTKAEIKLLLHAKGRYVRLKGKGWRRLQFDLTDEENERLARLGLNPSELSDEPQRLHALQLADDAAKRFLPEQQVEQIQRRVGEIKARVSPDLPAGIRADLRPYQLEGFHFLAYLSTNRFGGILADDMGLGKTLQALAWVLWLRDQANGRDGQGSRSPTPGQAAAQPALLPDPAPAPVLVVCPKSVMDNWHAEAGRFAQDLRVKVWPAGELGDLSKQLPSADVHVVNYSQLRTLGESLAPVRWLAVILDEGQYIKNPNSQTAQIARSLRAEHRLVLSGTPIENRLMDLWSLMAFAMPGVLGSRSQFGKIYDAKGDPFARRRLASRVRPFVLRRTKAQVAKDLPDRIEEDLFCEIEGEQMTLYRAELKRAQQLLLGIQTQKELAQQQFHFLTSLLRLRQICCHPRLMKPDSTAPSAKTEALLEQIAPLMQEGQKVLVFSQFVEMLDLLQPVLRAQGWPVFYLAGHTENRGELVRQFQSADGAAIFLISLKAGGFGLNLTAASYVMLFDPWWNPAVENQAIDRTHRIGQTRNVMAYRLLIKNSIEEKIRELQKQKKALAEDVLGEEKFAQGLSLDDLRFLFAD